MNTDKPTLIQSVGLMTIDRLESIALPRAAQFATRAPGNQSSRFLLNRRAGDL
jgi:hypothetical protein